MAQSIWDDMRQFSRYQKDTIYIKVPHDIYDKIKKGKEVVFIDGSGFSGNKMKVELKVMDEKKDNKVYATGDFSW